MGALAVVVGAAASAAMVGMGAACAMVGLGTATVVGSIIAGETGERIRHCWRPLRAA
jgi:hypothetical protein